MRGPDSRADGDKCPLTVRQFPCLQHVWIQTRASERVIWGAQSCKVETPLDSVQKSTSVGSKILSMKVVFLSAM